MLPKSKQATVTSSPPVQVSSDLGVEASLATDAGTPALAISPDGRVVAFVAQPDAAPVARIYLRRLDQLNALPLSNTEGAHSPFFSGDGQWLGFFADGKLRKISVTGGAAITLCDAPNGRGGAWADDGTIVFSPDNEPYVRLHRVSSTGGTPEPIGASGPREWHQRWPQIMPGGNAVLYTGNDAAGLDEANLVVQPLPNGARRVVHRGGYYGRYLTTGHLAYIDEGALFVTPFDLDRLEVIGPPFRVLENVKSSQITGAAQFAISADTLVYLRGGTAISLMPIDLIDREGKTAALVATPANWFNVHFARDGRRLAMERCDAATCDVWIHAADGTSKQLTSHPADDYAPVWTWDAQRIAFASTRADGLTDNLYWQRADRPDEPQRLTHSRNPQLPGSWHPSGAFLVFEERLPATQEDLMILRVKGDENSGWMPGQPTVFLSTAASEREPTFSPDGRWVAYSSNESGRYEVYVRPFPGPGEKRLISTGGGTSPTWSLAKPELFYGTNTGEIMTLSYEVIDASFRAAAPRLWSPHHFMRRGRNRMFALHPDGERFAVAPASPTPADATHRQVTFVFNFSSGLRPEGKR